VADPRPGDFGVVGIPGRSGRLIRVGQWLNGDGYHDYEHAFVVAEVGSVLEARPSGAGYAHTPVGAAYYRCPEWARENVVAAAESMIGTPYSWVDYFALAAVRFRLPLSSKLLRGYVHSSGHMICSQFVDEAYQRAGVQLFDDGRLPGDVTPGDLYGLIRIQQANEATW